MYISSLCPCPRCFYIYIVGDSMDFSFTFLALQWIILPKARTISEKKKVQHIYYLSFAVSCRKTSLLTARDILYYSEGNHKSSQTSTWLHVTVTFLTCKASNNVNFIRPTAKFCVKEELYYVCHKAQQTSFLMKY